MENERLADIERKLDAVATMVSEMHAELVKYKPLLSLLGNGSSDLQRAGLVRAMRKAARGAS